MPENNNTKPLYPWAYLHSPAPAEEDEQQTTQNEQSMTPAEAEPQLGIIGTAADVIKQVVGGAFKEAENVVQSGHDIADFIDNTIGDGTAIEDGKDYDFVPDPLKPQTSWGRTAQAMSSFVWGWVAGGKMASLAFKGVSKALPAAAKIAKLAPNSEWVRRTMKGAAVDFVTGDGTDERFADVLMDNDILADGIIGYLASDPDDSFFEARAKNAAEGFFLGTALDVAVTPLLRGMKKVYKASRTGSPEAVIKARAEATEEIEKALTGTAEERIAAAGGARTGLTLTKTEAVKEANELIASDPEKALEEFRKLKADTQKALNTAHYTEKAQAFIEAFQPALADAAEPHKVNMNESIADALDYILKNGLDKRFNKEAMLNLRNTGSREDFLKATAVESLYLSAFAPRHAAIELEKLAEGIEGALPAVRKIAEDTYDVLIDLKLANMFAGQAGKMNDAVRLAGESLSGASGTAAKAAEKAAGTAATNGKELFAKLTDQEVVNYLTTHNTLVRNGDMAGAKELAEHLAKTAGRGADGLDRLNSWRYFAMLSSLKTQIRNLVGNTSKIPLMAFEESVKGAVMGYKAADGGILGAFAGAKNGLYYLQGIKAGHRQAFQNFLNSIKYDMAITRPSEASQAARNADVNWSFAKPVITLPTKMLRAADEYFATLGGTAAAYENAMLELKRSGVLKGAPKELQAEITEKWLRDSLAQAFGTVTTKDGVTIRGSLRFKESVEMADELTFQQELGGFAQSLYNIVSKYRGLRLIFPFVKTPTNIFKDVMWTRGLNLPREFSAAFKEGATPEQQAQAAAHLASAAGIWLSAYGLYASGRLTGEGPKNRLAKEAKQATGWRPNSLKIGDSYVTLDAFEPFGTALGTLAAFMERLERMEADNDEIGLESLGTQALQTLLYTVQNKTYLRGLASFFNSYNGDTMFESYGVAGQFMASLVPSIFRDFGYAFDPVKRETPTVLSKAQERTPFWRGSLPPRVSWLTGQDMETGNGPIGAFVNGLNLSKEEEDAVMYELSRLDGVGEPDKKILGGYELTPEEYAEYKRAIGTSEIGGRTLYRALSDLINSDVYRRHSEQFPDPSDNKIEERRAEMLRNIIKQYKDYGKQRYLQQNPQIREAAMRRPVFAGIAPW